MINGAIKFIYANKVTFDFSLKLKCVKKKMNMKNIYSYVYIYKQNIST